MKLNYTIISLLIFCISFQVISQDFTKTITISKIKPLIFRKHESNHLKIIVSDSSSTCFKKSIVGFYKKVKKKVDYSYFVDSLNYELLDKLIMNLNYHEDSVNTYQCDFYCYTLYVIKITEGDPCQSKTRSYVFSSPVSCVDEKNKLFLQRIIKKYFDLLEEIK